MNTPFEFQLLHIFTNHGKTFTFKKGMIHVDNESVLSFDYNAASDGYTKRGVFSKANMAGFSILFPSSKK